MLRLIFVLQLLYVSTSSLGMEVVLEWWTDKMDLKFPSEEFRIQSILDGTFIPEKFWINGLEVHKNKLFITLPWSLRNSATVAYVNLESSPMSPKFMPYPSWDAYLPDEKGKRRIGQVFRARADRCDRLWLLEKVSEYNDRLRIIVMDLNSDTIIRTYTFPAALHFSLYNNWIVLEDGDCQNTFAYVNDYSLGGFWTYSWVKNDSWHIDGYKNIYAMILSPNCNDAYSTLYYQMYSSTDLHESFFVSTKHLRDKKTALSTEHLSYEKSEAVYLRAAILDPATNVLYITENPTRTKNLRLILCWNKNNDCHVNGISELTINVDSNTEFGDDMAVDREGNLWIEAKRGPKTAILKFSPPFDY